jgi:hypothetical protein
MKMEMELSRRRDGDEVEKKQRQKVPYLEPSVRYFADLEGVKLIPLPPMEGPMETNRRLRARQVHERVPKITTVPAQR